MCTCVCALHFTHEIFHTYVLATRVGLVYDHVVRNRKCSGHAPGVVVVVDAVVVGTTISTDTNTKGIVLYI